MAEDFSSSVNESKFVDFDFIYFRWYFEKKSEFFMSFIETRTRYSLKIEQYSQIAQPDEYNG